jgi:hypothetical protein
MHALDPSRQLCLGRRLAACNADAPIPNNTCFCLIRKTLLQDPLLSHCVEGDKLSRRCAGLPVGL